MNTEPNPEHKGSGSTPVGRWVLLHPLAVRQPREPLWGNGMFVLFPSSKGARLMMGLLLCQLFSHSGDIFHPGPGTVRVCSGYGLASSSPDRELKWPL